MTIQPRDSLVSRFMTSAQSALRQRTSLLLTLVLLLLLNACQPQPTAPQTRSSAPPRTQVATASDDPAQIVQAFYAALNAGQVAAAGRYVAEEATFVNITGRYEGAAAIAAYLHETVADNITFALHDLHTDNDRVTYWYQVFQDGLLIETGTAGLTVARTGWIVFDGTQHNEVDLIARHSTQIVAAI